MEWNHFQNLIDFNYSFKSYISCNFESSFKSEDSALSPALNPEFNPLGVNATVTATVANREQSRVAEGSQSTIAGSGTYIFWIPDKFYTVSDYE